MAAGGRRASVGDRVLEGRHVIGLFFLMLLFSGIFFTLGFVMGRQQYDGQVRAASTTHGGSEAPAPLKPEAKKPNNFVSSGPSADPAAQKKLLKLSLQRIPLLRRVRIGSFIMRAKAKRPTSI